MGDTGDYINSAPRSEVSFSVRISSRSSSPLEAHQFCNFESSSRLEVHQVPKFFTLGSASRFEASLYIFVTLGAIVHYNEIMEGHRLGSDNLHSLPAPPENLPNDYVMVQYSSRSGEFAVQFALHRHVLLHLMGRGERLIGGPHTRRYLRTLTNLQEDAIVETRRKDSTNKDEDEEESPDR